MKLTRRRAIAGALSFPAVSAMAMDASERPVPDPGASTHLGSVASNSSAQLRVATCQFPVGPNLAENAKYIRAFMHDAVAKGAHLLHTSEAALTGYAEVDLPSFHRYDWEALRKETSELRRLAQQLKIWLVLGSAHFLDKEIKPTNCLYLIGPEGQIVDRYDKCFLAGFEKAADLSSTEPVSPGTVFPNGDAAHYSAGDRLVIHEIRGVSVGLAICYDICWPQLYIAYRERGAKVMLHSFHNARMSGRNCLETLNVRQVPTRCADNRMWAVCNNSSQPYSEWGSFVARPDATIARQLSINEPGLLIHDFPDGLSEGGWFHNYRPMGKRDDELMHWGTPVAHPRRLNGQAEP